MPRKNPLREVLRPCAVIACVLAARSFAADTPAQAAVAGADALAGAMQRQQALVRAWPAGERIAGYKIAFNTPGMQRRFGLSRPAVAVLPASAERCPERTVPCVVSRDGESRPVVEVEIALRLGSDVTRPLADETELLAYLDAAMPAVELPELTIEGIDAPTGLDYIATDIGVRGFILGKVHDPALLHEPPPMSLARDGRQLATGRGDAALGAALTLVNEALAAGYELRAGQVLLTGVVGAMVPGEPGNYVAHYGALGEIRFTQR